MVDRTPTPGDAPTSDARRLIGQVISGRYRIDELIGEGGMGAVYRAEHTNMRKRLAVKVLHPEMLGLSEAVERFEREAIAGAHIEHPNVAAATDFGKLDDGSHFLVLEFLEGEDLRTVIGRGPLPPERALRIARQVALALRAAHQLGVVHRDLKPENVMLIRKDREIDVVKVLDFGIAKVPVNDIGSPSTRRTAAALTKLGMVYGTPEYMPPEQAMGDEVDGRADLYALGVVLYEMLCGVRPFEAESRVALLGMIATKKAPSLATRVPGTSVPAEIEAITMRLLAKTARDRFPDADALVEAIDVVMLELDYRMQPSLSLGRGGSSPDRRLGSAPDRAAPSSPALRQTSTADALSQMRGPPSSGPLEVLITAMGPEDLERSPPAATSASLGRPRLAQASTGLLDRGVMGDKVALGSDRPPSARPPLPAVLLPSGLAAIALVIAVAVAVRGTATVDALESAATPSSASGPRAGGDTPSSGATPSEPTPEPGPRASRAEVDAARARGLAGLGALALQYPSDPNVLEALLLAHAADRNLPQAMGTAKLLLELEPSKATDEDVRQVVLMAASGPPDASAVAFEVMGARMGASGPDLIYELAIAPSVGRFAKERATRALADPAVRAAATPALLIAWDLKAVQPCQRKPLFARAAAVGDVRALHYLKPMLATTGCGFFGRGDCYGCLGGRAELRTTIDTITNRPTTPRP